MRVCAWVCVHVFKPRFFTWSAHVTKQNKPRVMVERRCESLRQKRRQNTAEADAWLRKSPNAPQNFPPMCSGAFQSSAMMNPSEGRTSAPSSPLSPSSLPSHLHAAQQALSTRAIPLNMGLQTYTC